MRRACVLLAGLLVTGACLATEPKCSADARAQAARLLAFHADNDERMAIDDEVKELPRLRNPANPTQRFRVLEVTGHIYRAQYRMRLLYGDIDGDCVLVGQEILEHVSL